MKLQYHGFSMIMRDLVVDSDCARILRFEILVQTSSLVTLSINDTFHTRRNYAYFSTDSGIHFYRVARERARTYRPFATRGRLLQVLHCIFPKAQEQGCYMCQEVRQDRIGKTQYHKTPKTIRSDRGREYVNDELRAYLKAEGIHIEYTAAYPPQQNGMAEKKIDIYLKWHAVC
ncbi:uncharacterized protein LOC116416858 [Nasonia vitripennis]|uniref:Integrase catalytic domain-containing protein n=1 Tax=Nasonia vitripennis TaxID=7425 RepID=A0A7M7QBG4_NASVI|nr:uncharacterized protein LOC116416858 [Nasonia vitripennis]